MSGTPSAGILLFRRVPALEVLLVHPGGPFWRNRDAGAWQIPKGMIEPGETPEDAALREVAEELGVAVTAPLLPLGSVRQSGGKRVIAFAAEQAVDVAAIVSIEFEMEWPPRSGTLARFPEVDRAAWYPLAEARTMMLPSQLPLVDRLADLLDR